jgi:hypothetical protein
VLWQRLEWHTCWDVLGRVSAARASAGYKSSVLERMSAWPAGVPHAPCKPCDCLQRRLRWVVMHCTPLQGKPLHRPRLCLHPRPKPCSKSMMVVHAMFWTCFQLPTAPGHIMPPPPCLDLALVFCTGPALDLQQPHSWCQVSAQQPRGSDSIHAVSAACLRSGAVHCAVWVVPISCPVIQSGHSKHRLASSNSPVLST